jgi:hypothetical protein
LNETPRKPSPGDASIRLAPSLLYARVVMENEYSDVGVVTSTVDRSADTDTPTSVITATDDVSIAHAPDGRRV